MKGSHRCRKRRRSRERLGNNTATYLPTECLRSLHILVQPRENTEAQCIATMNRMIIHRLQIVKDSWQLGEDDSRRSHHSLCCIESCFQSSYLKHGTEAHDAQNDAINNGLAAATSDSERNDVGKVNRRHEQIDHVVHPKKSKYVLLYNCWVLVSVGYSSTQSSLCSAPPSVVLESLQLNGVQVAQKKSDTSLAFFSPLSS